MDKGTAERWVVISALVVAGIYGYRRVVEPAEKGNLKNILGQGNPVPIGQFVTAWGFCYLVIAIMAEASPGLGGAFAILIGVSDLLTNGPALFGDINKQQGAQQGTNPQTLAATQAANLFDTPSGTSVYQPPTNLPNPVK